MPVAHHVFFSLIEGRAEPFQTELIGLVSTHSCTWLVRFGYGSVWLAFRMKILAQNKTKLTDVQPELNHNLFVLYTDK